MITCEDKENCELHVMALAANNSFAVAKTPDSFDETGERKFYLTGMYGNLDLVVREGEIAMIGMGAYLGLDEKVFRWEDVQAGLDLIRDRYAERAQEACMIN